MVGPSSPFLGGRRRAARKQAAALADDLTADVADCAREAHYGGFAACPLLTERGKAILATYDYESATAPAYSTRLGWVADVHFIPRLYWSVWLRGYLLGVWKGGSLRVEGGTVGRLGGPDRGDVLFDVVDANDVGAPVGRQRRRRHRRRQSLAGVLAADQPFHTPSR